MTTIFKNLSISAVRNFGIFAATIGLGISTIGCTSTHKPVADTRAPNAPFDAMVMRHTVSDYDKWKSHFDADAHYHDAAGIHDIGVARGLENPNEIEVPSIIDDVAKAKVFVADPRLKEITQKAGVISGPEVKFIHVLRMTDVGKCDYAEVIAHVKDFDAWLKVFDSEGPATRKKDGLTDIVLGRGIDDPNLVYLVFKINSVAEANAALANPDRQKLMQESGVIGKPAVFFGRDQ